MFVRYAGRLDWYDLSFSYLTAAVLRCTMRISVWESAAANVPTHKSYVNKNTFSDLILSAYF